MNTRKKFDILVTAYLNWRVYFLRPVQEKLFQGYIANWIEH